MWSAVGIKSLAVENVPMIAWCDSKIVLAWLATHPSKWATFVAHRASEIHDNIDAKCWRYISTKKNPADIASRGSTMKEIEQSTMWWHGPSFLTSPFEESPIEIHELPIDTAPEKRKQANAFHVDLPKSNDLLDGFEDLTRLLYFTCLVFRWKIKAKGSPMLNKPIGAEEMDRAENHWIRVTQSQYFALEMSKLKANKPLPRGSMLLKLSPFIDNEGILRMNG